MTTRALMICGSLQARSANRAALDVIEARLRHLDGVEVDEYRTLDQIPAFNPDDNDDPGPVVTDFRARLGAADVVIIASPEYAGSMAGALKNALDWIVGSGELYARPVAIASAGTSGGEHARHHLIRSLTWQGAHVVADVGIAAPRTLADADGRYTDVATIAALEELADTAIAAPHLAAEDRLTLVRNVIERLGIDAVHIAPVS